MWITAAVLLGAIGPAQDAAAKPPAPAAIDLTPIRRDRLPDGVLVRGDKLEHAMTFRDKHGTHYLVMSSTDPATKAGAGRPNSARYLYVDDWVVSGTGKPRSLLPVRDMVTDCEMGAVTVQFHDAATSVTDLDRDGLAEVTFGYELGCRSDVSPATYKLLVIEHGDKYILRGKTRVDPDGTGSIVGGTFEPDPAPARWPAGFLDHARQRWEATADDLESPPRRPGPAHH